MCKVGVQGKQTDYARLSDININNKNSFDQIKVDPHILIKPSNASVKSRDTKGTQSEAEEEQRRVEDRRETA